MKTIALAILLTVSVAADDKIGPAKFTSEGHTTDSLSTVKERIKQKKAVLIDVREKSEWNAGHLKAAKLVPMSVVKTGKLSTEIKKNLPKDKPIYCHCRSGRRVLTVSKLLRAQGYDVRPLKAGYSKLLTEGFAKATK